jgi:hypothetical protein
MLHDVKTTPEPGMALYRHECQRCGEIKLSNREHWKSECKGPKGLGDYVEMFASLFGIPACEGCKERKQWLNSLTKGK